MKQHKAPSKSTFWELIAITLNIILEQAFWGQKEAMSTRNFVPNLFTNEILF